MSTAYESQLEVSVDVPARAPYSTVLQQGQELAIIDLGGNQAVDFLCYDANDTAKRYSAAATIAAQRNIFLTTGSVVASASEATTTDAMPIRRSVRMMRTATSPRLATRTFVNIGWLSR